MLGALIHVGESQDGGYGGQGRGRRVLRKQAVHEARVQSSDVHAAEGWRHQHLRTSVKSITVYLWMTVNK